METDTTIAASEPSPEAPAAPSGSADASIIAPDQNIDPVPAIDLAPAPAKPELSDETKIALAALKVLTHFGGADQARQHIVERAERHPESGETLRLWDAFQANKLSEYLAHLVA